VGVSSCSLAITWLGFLQRKYKLLTNALKKKQFNNFKMF